MTAPHETPWSDPVAAGWSTEALDTGVAHAARVYDYLLGGKDNFAADREVAEATAAAFPEIPGMARCNRDFLGRAVKFLIGQGIRQFLDIGPGLPSAGNTHEITQVAAPDATVVYVDNDPLVVAHGRALLGENARTRVLEGDIRRPDEILNHPEVTNLIDFSRPVAILIVAVLHFVFEVDDPTGIVSRFKAAAAPGSYLVISHAAIDIGPAREEVLTDVYRTKGSGEMRTREQVEKFFDGFTLLEPGLVQAPQWRPDGPVPEDLEKYWIYAGVGRKDS